MPRLTDARALTMVVGRVVNNNCLNGYKHYPLSEILKNSETNKSSRIGDCENVERDPRNNSRIITVEDDTTDTSIIDSDESSGGGGGRGGGKFKTNRSSVTSRNKRKRVLLRDDYDDDAEIGRPPPAIIRKGVSGGYSTQPMESVAGPSGLGGRSLNRETPVPAEDDSDNTTGDYDPLSQSRAYADSALFTVPETELFNANNDSDDIVNMAFEQVQDKLRQEVVAQGLDDEQSSIDFNENDEVILSKLGMDGTRNLAKNFYRHINESGHQQHTRENREDCVVRQSCYDPTRCEQMQLGMHDLVTMIQTYVVPESSDHYMLFDNLNNKSYMCDVYRPIPIEAWNNGWGHAYAINLDLEFVPLCFDFDYDASRLDTIDVECVDMQFQKRLALFITHVIHKIYQPFIEENDRLSKSNWNILHYAVFERLVDEDDFSRRGGGKNYHVYFNFSISTLLYCWIIELGRDFFQSLPFKLDPVTVLAFPYSSKRDNDRYTFIDKCIVERTVATNSNDWGFPNLNKCVAGEPKLVTVNSQTVGSNFELGIFTRTESKMEDVFVNSRAVTNQLLLLCDPEGKNVHISDTETLELHLPWVNSCGYTTGTLSEFHIVGNFQSRFTILLKYIFPPMDTMDMSFSADLETIFHETLFKLTDNDSVDQSNGVAADTDMDGTTTNDDDGMGWDTSKVQPSSLFRSRYENFHVKQLSKMPSGLNARITEILENFNVAFKKFIKIVYFVDRLTLNLMVRTLYFDGFRYTYYLIYTLINLVFNHTKKTMSALTAQEVKTYVLEYLYQIVLAVRENSFCLVMLRTVLGRMKNTDFSLNVFSQHSPLKWFQYLADQYQIIRSAQTSGPVRRQINNSQRPFQVADSYIHVFVMREFRNKNSWDVQSYDAIIQDFLNLITVAYSSDSAVNFAMNPSNFYTYHEFDIKNQDSFIAQRLDAFMRYTATFKQYEALQKAKKIKGRQALLNSFYNENRCQLPDENFYTYCINTRYGVFNTITGTYMANVPFLFFNCYRDHCVGSFYGEAFDDLTSIGVNMSALMTCRRTVELWVQMNNVIEDLYLLTVLVPGLMTLRHIINPMPFSGQGMLRIIKYLYEILTVAKKETRNRIFQNVMYMSVVFITYPLRPLHVLYLGKRFMRYYEAMHGNRTTDFDNILLKLQSDAKSLVPYLNANNERIEYHNDIMLYSKIVQMYKKQVDARDAAIAGGGDGNGHTFIDDFTPATSHEIILYFCVGYLLCIYYDELYTQPMDESLAQSNVFLQAIIFTECLKRPAANASIVSTGEFAEEPVYNQDYIDQSLENFVLLPSEFVEDTLYIYNDTTTRSGDKLIETNKLRAFNMLNRLLNKKQGIFVINDPTVDLMYEYCKLFAYDSRNFYEFFIYNSSIYNPTATRKFLICLVGVSRSGKSTFQERMRTIHGNSTYSATNIAPAAGSNKPSPDLCHVLGNYYAQFTECDKLDNATLKVLTGGDSITVRNLYRSSKNMRSVATIVLASNTVPNIKSDLGTLTRLAMFAFRYEYKIIMASNRNALELWLTNTLMCVPNRDANPQEAEVLSNILYAVYYTKRGKDGLYQPTGRITNEASVNVNKVFLSKNLQVLSVNKKLKIVRDIRLKITVDQLTMLFDTAVKNGVLDGDCKFEEYLDQFRTLYAPSMVGGDTFIGVGRLHENFAATMGVKIMGYRIKNSPNTESSDETGKEAVAVVDDQQLAAPLDGGAGGSQNSKSHNSTTPPKGQRSYSALGKLARTIQAHDPNYKPVLDEILMAYKKAYDPKQRIIKNYEFYFEPNNK